MEVDKVADKVGDVVADMASNTKMINNNNNNVFILKNYVTISITN